MTKIHQNAALRAAFLSFFVFLFFFLTLLPLFATKGSNTPRWKICLNVEDFGDGVGERLGAKQTCPLKTGAQRASHSLSLLLPAGITMGLDRAGAALAA